jgi:hypothetical protein
MSALGMGPNQRIVQDREFAEEMDGLKSPGYTSGGDIMGFFGSDIFTVKKYPALRRMVHPGYQVKYRSLAGSVGTDQRPMDSAAISSSGSPAKPGRTGNVAPGPSLLSKELRQTNINRQRDLSIG